MASGGVCVEKVLEISMHAVSHFRRESEVKHSGREATIKFSVDGTFN